MRVGFIIIVVFTFIVNSDSQDLTSSDNWIFKIHASVEEHDKRLFGYSEKELLQELHEDEFWGTYSAGLTISRYLVLTESINLSGGLGLRYEERTFTRPWEPTHIVDDFYLRILLHQNRYKEIYATLPISGNYHFTDNLGLNILLRYNLELYKQIDNTIDPDPNGVYPSEEYKFGFDSMELFAGAFFEVSQFQLNLSWRVINVQKIDKIIFNKLIDYPYDDKKIESFNPVKFQLSLGYKF